MGRNFSILLLLAVLTACSSNVQQTHTVYDVHASFSTPPSRDGEDHMDDPTIYVNDKDPSKSFVIGTNKSRVGGGLHLYDLEGNEIDFVADGRMNNVDLRYGFPLRTPQGVEKIDLAVATHRSQKSVAIYKVDAKARRLINVTADGFSFDFSPYGGCLYHNRQTDKFYFFATSKPGKVQQIELVDQGNGKIGAKSVRFFDVGSICEGCVADDENGTLFVAEEDVAVWKYKADPLGGTTREKVDAVGQHFVADIEGLTLYYGADGTGYLIASSQGNSTYVVYERQAPHSYVGTFQIASKGTMEGTEETDGIDVTHHALPNFPKGLFVAHDNRSTKGGGSNFKFVSWDQIARGLKK